MSSRVAVQKKLAVFLAPTVELDTAAKRYRTMSEVKLTKKQKKASAFRSTKGKGKKVDGEPLDVPENDLNEDGEEEEGEGTIKAPKDKSKKRKIERVEDGDDATKEGGEGGEEGADGEEPKKKKRQRGKKPGARMEAGNSRLILFVGELVDDTSLVCGGGC